MQFDATGLSVTLASAEALEMWNRTIDNSLAHALATPATLARTLGLEPEFALGHAVKGLATLMLATREVLPISEAALATARRSASERPISSREAAYIDALSAWLGGSAGRAAAILEQVHVGEPSDVLAFKLAYGIRFMLGDRRAMLESSTRARVSCRENFQFTGYIEGCRAFALEENGLYAEAERAGRVAVQMEPRDIWGRHAVAHVLEMTGRPHEGIRWLADERTWEHANNFRFHIIWHLALFHLDQGDSAEVLRLYDEEIQTGATQDFRDLANSASLLARLEFDGVHVGERWEILGEIARSRIADRRLVFADLHYVLALLGAGRRDSAELIASGLLQDVERGDDAERGASAVPGASTAKGLLAYHAGDYDDAARHLGLARSGLQTIGGSHAQRDVFEQAYIESLLRSGAHDLAISVLCERLARRGGVNGYASRRLARLRGPALGPALPAAPETRTSFAH